MRRSALCIVLLAPLAALAQTYTYLDQSLKNGNPVHTALLIAPDVVMAEISAGGVVQKIPEWSKQAREHITAALRGVDQRTKLKLAELPALSAEEQHALEQHVALYGVVAFNVHRNSLSGGDLWAKRLQSGLTDYTVGPRARRACGNRADRGPCRDSRPGSRSSSRSQRRRNQRMRESTIDMTMQVVSGK